MKRQQQLFGESHPDVATAFNALGNIYCQIEDYKNALPYLQKGLEIQKVCYTSQLFPHPDVARSLSDIGILLLKSLLSFLSFFILFSVFIFVRFTALTK